MVVVLRRFPYTRSHSVMCMSRAFIYTPPESCSVYVAGEASNLERTPQLLGLPHTGHDTQAMHDLATRENQTVVACFGSALKKNKLDGSALTSRTA